MVIKIVAEVVQVVVATLIAVHILVDNMDTALVVALHILDTLVDNLDTLVVVLDILDTLVDNLDTLVVALDTLDKPIQALVVWDNLDTHMVACHQVLVVVAKLDRQSWVMVVQLQSCT